MLNIQTFGGQLILVHYIMLLLFSHMYIQGWNHANLSSVKLFGCT